MPIKVNFTRGKALRTRSEWKWRVEMELYTETRKKIGTRRNSGFCEIVSFVHMCVGFSKKKNFCSVAFWMQSRYKPKVMPMNFFPLSPSTFVWCAFAMQSWSTHPVTPLCESFLLCVSLVKFCRPESWQKSRETFEKMKEAPKKCLDVHIRLFAQKEVGEKIFFFASLPAHLSLNEFLFYPTHTYTQAIHTHPRGDVMRRHFGPADFQICPTFRHFDCVWCVSSAAVWL